jgi:hypothetical protein
MSKDTFKVLDYIIENPNPQLELAINSNCVLPDKLFDKFIEKIKIIQDNKCVKKFTLYTSAEAYGDKAEYIRHGMDYTVWLDSCDKFLEQIPTANFSIMSTYNALSVTSYIEFLKDVLIMKLRLFIKHFFKRMFLPKDIFDLRGIDRHIRQKNISITKYFAEKVNVEAKEKAKELIDKMLSEFVKNNLNAPK